MNGPMLVTAAIIAVIVGAIVVGIHAIGAVEDRDAAKKAAEDAAGEAEFARKFGPRLVPSSAPVRPAPAGGEVVVERPEPVDFTADPHAP